MLLAAGLTVASALDFRTRRIPNTLTAAMAITGLALSLLRVSPLSPLAALLGIVVGMLLMLPGHVLGATGAGDVKLMGAVGAFMGPWPVTMAFVATAIAGGVLAMIVAARRGRVGSTLQLTALLVTNRGMARPAIESTGKANRFAYAPAIAIGTLVVVFGQLRG